MSKYSTNRKPTTKAITINIDLEDQSNEEQLRSILKQGNDLLQTLETMAENKLQRTEEAVAKVKQDIEDLKTQ